MGCFFPPDANTGETFEKWRWECEELCKPRGRVAATSKRIKLICYGKQNFESIGTRLFWCYVQVWRGLFSFVCRACSATWTTALRRTSPSEWRSGNNDNNNEVLSKRGPLVLLELGALFRKKRLDQYNSNNKLIHLWTVHQEIQPTSHTHTHTTQQVKWGNLQKEVEGVQI